MPNICCSTQVEVWRCVAYTIQEKSNIIKTQMERSNSHGQHWDGEICKEKKPWDIDCREKSRAGRHMDQGFLDPIGRGGHGSMRLFQKYSSDIISHSGGVVSILLEDIFRKKSYGRAPKYGLLWSQWSLSLCGPWRCPCNVFRWLYTFVWKSRLFYFWLNSLSLSSATSFPSYFQSFQAMVCPWAFMWPL